ncbi:hypothetical protein [Prosthecobacter fusiformis]|nr:hypothetical protein [Prosthecobacter fusiformis]
MKIIASVFLLVLSVAVPHLIHAEEFDSRDAIGITSGRSVAAALKRAEKENKQVLVFAVDETKKSQSFHIKGMLEFEETKQQVRDHFILVVTDFKDKNIRAIVANESTERPFYILFNKDGSVVQKGTTAMGGTLGAKLVKEWTEKK